MKTYYKHAEKSGSLSKLRDIIGNRIHSRTLGNAEDGVVSAFPTGKQNGEIALKTMFH